MRRSGFQLDDLRKRAQSKDFRPVPLGIKLQVELQTNKATIRTANVLGVLPGSDPRMKEELVVYTAHHDHLGIGKVKQGDAIYNGALDNGSGVAALLSIAESFTTLRPKRSVLFAAVAAEESGLLGAKYYCAHPTVPPGRIAANINIDGINIWGKTRDVTFVGLGKAATIDQIVVNSARELGKTVVPDQFPDRGHFYRSDQFEFARIGVPAVYLDSGTDFVGHDTKWGKEQIEAYERQHYHQPSDELRADWNFAGAIEDLQLLVQTGWQIANLKDIPRWNKGDEFERVRLDSLKKNK